MCLWLWVYFSISRSLEEFDAAVATHGKELEKDLLIKHHLGILYDQLLESNLLKIIQVCYTTSMCTNDMGIKIVTAFICLYRSTLLRSLRGMPNDDRPFPCDVTALTISDSRNLDAMFCTLFHRC